MERRVYLRLAWIVFVEAILVRCFFTLKDKAALEKAIVNAEKILLPLVPAAEPEHVFHKALYK